MLYTVINSKQYTIKQNINKLKGINMISKTSLISCTVQCKIFGALRSAKNNGHAYVKNKKGQNFLKVCYLNGEQAWRILGVSSGFVWYNKNRDVTNIVNASLTN